MKNEIRTRILALRRELPESVLNEKSKTITKKVINHPFYKQAELVFAYIDAKGEVMTEELIRHAWKQGKKVAVPKIHGEVMEFYLITSFEQLEYGCFGLMEPDDMCPKVIDIPENSMVLMPGVAFDRTGNRIGYGKGYYDKYFTKFPNLNKIALSLDIQVVPEISAEPHDLKADCVITEENEWRK